MVNVQNLLNLIEVINQKYVKLSKNSINFNIFTVLRNESDEVNLHSKFIIELISNIPHFSDVFLKLFLKNIDVEESYFTSKIKVLREYKNIDILIKSNDKNLIIENKIYAEDQPKQLERYYKEMKTIDNKVKILYLTLDGHSPSKNSLGKLLCSETDIVENKEVVVNISYKDNIAPWIEECIKETSRVPELRETLIQYLEVINKLNGQTESKDYYNEIAELIIQDSKKLKLANDIRTGFDLAVNGLKFEFWKELEREVKNINELQYFKENTVSINYDKYSVELIKKNKKYHSILYSVLKLSETEELAFRFEIDHLFYYGYGIIVDNNWLPECNNKRYNKIKEIIIEESQNKLDSLCFSKNQSTKWWFSYIYLTNKFNYRYPDEAFFKLADEEYRKKLIVENLNIIADLTKTIINRIKQEVKL